MVSSEWLPPGWMAVSISWSWRHFTTPPSCRRLHPMLCAHTEVGVTTNLLMKEEKKSWRFCSPCHTSFAYFSMPCISSCGRWTSSDVGVEQISHYINMSCMFPIPLMKVCFHFKPNKVLINSVHRKFSIVHHYIIDREVFTICASL